MHVLKKQNILMVTICRYRPTSFLLRCSIVYSLPLHIYMHTLRGGSRPSAMGAKLHNGFGGEVPLKLSTFSETTFLTKLAHKFWIFIDYIASVGARLHQHIMVRVSEV